MHDSEKGIFKGKCYSLEDVFAQQNGLLEIVENS